MTAPVLALCDGPRCPGVPEGALTVRTALGRFCAPCWKAACEPVPEPCTRAEVDARSAALAGKVRA